MAEKTIQVRNRPEMAIKNLGMDYLTGRMNVIISGENSRTQLQLGGNASQMSHKSQTANGPRNRPLTASRLSSASKGGNLGTAGVSLLRDP